MSRFHLLLMAIAVGTLLLSAFELCGLLPPRTMAVLVSIPMAFLLITSAIGIAFDRKATNTAAVKHLSTD